MEESVALDSVKQKQFVKSVQLLKKRVKKNVGEPDSKKKDDSAKTTRRKLIRGLVYLSHIPHGFYEHQMTQYFKQFGVVTNSRVIRSKRTGNSKGFAFVEFKDTGVAQIVAETMNNYLMGKRLIKAVYIPPEKQRKAFRRNWNTQNNPGTNMRKKMMKNHNAKKSDQQELRSARKHISNLERTKSKLAEFGINYDFFTPVDVPKPLLKELNVGTISKKENENPKRKLPVVGEIPKSKKTKKLNDAVNKPEIEKKNKVQEQKQLVKNPKKEVVLTKADKKQQKKKQETLKGKGVKPVEEFIKLQSGSDGESDSEYEFNSDEYEKMMGSESDVDSNDGADSGSDDDGDSIDEITNDSNDEKDSSDESDLSTEEIIIKKSPPKKAKNNKIKPQQLTKTGNYKRVRKSHR